RPGRRSRPLGGANPLEAALAAVRDELAPLGGPGPVAVGFVADCRRWTDADHAGCLGEFLDVVPVLLDGDADHLAVAERLGRARQNGLHYLHALSTEPDGDALLRELQAVYRTPQGGLGLVLVNFQGFVREQDYPDDDHPDGAGNGPLPAVAQFNIWHDDQALHLELLSGDAGAGREGRS
ncbi:MAG: hypothetical protein QM582_11325, partial [Micropruina sp.]|uniref:hypothetical protein n=1 Tax=Micropruina sp. TaxID=2737536 RepID=UPI0039E48D78